MCRPGYFFTTSGFSGTCMGALFASFRRERHVPKSWRWPVESHSDLRNLRASLIDVHDGIVRLLVGGKILHPQRLSEEHLFVKLDKRSMRVDHLCGCARKTPLQCHAARKSRWNRTAESVGYAVVAPAVGVESEVYSNSSLLPAVFNMHKGSHCARKAIRHPSGRPHWNSPRKPCDGCALVPAYFSHLLEENSFGKH